MKKRKIPFKCFSCGCDLYLIQDGKNTFVYRKSVYFCRTCVSYNGLQKKALK